MPFRLGGFICQFVLRKWRNEVPCQSPGWTLRPNGETLSEPPAELDCRAAGKICKNQAIPTHPGGKGTKILGLFGKSDSQSAFICANRAKCPFFAIAVNALIPASFRQNRATARNLLIGFESR